MFISFLICTYNRADSLFNTLDLLIKSIEYSHLSNRAQIIVINNNSSDHTAQVTSRIEEYLKVHAYISFNYGYEIKQGKGYALLHGLSLVKGDYVCFLDDDNLFFENTYKSLVQAIENNPNALLGSINIVDPELNLPDWFSQFEHNFACGRQHQYYQSQGAIWGAGMTVPFSKIKVLIDAGFSFVLNCREGNKLSSGSDTELSFLFRFLGLEVILPDGYKLTHKIDSGRLNITNLIKLNFGFGVAAPYLALYEKQLQKRIKQNNNQVICDLDLIIHVKDIFRLLSRFNLTSFLQVVYRIGILYCLYFDRERLNLAQSKIEKLFSKI